ncbi:FmdE family protein [Desulfospira joergensenii]|uniref:FmdE family protein n=1 Tax=Desulfospira joergensenii TaxID=53329 RepID=UPI0003B3FCBE|nr:FmdE family protein [Desulfospira joergensenii]
MKDFETLLKGSGEAHGHLCPGQVVGVKMAMEGCRLIGLDEPSILPQIKKLLVYVEMDRCAADAISYVTGAKLGRRSLKFVDNGIMAATFVNLESGRAFRIVSREEARELALVLAPEIPDKRGRQMEAYKRMSIEELFDIEEVRVDVPACDMPGPTRFKAVCARCGQMVRDKREIMKNNEILCRPCGLGSYFQPINEQGKENVPRRRAQGSQNPAL